MSNVLAIAIILGLVAFSTAMIVGIVKRVREIRQDKKKKAQSSSVVDVHSADEDKNNEKEVSE